MTARILFVLLSYSALPCHGAEPPTLAEIPLVVKQLGHPNYYEREAAQARLELLGPDAALKLADLRESDPEIIDRLRAVVASLAAKRTGFMTLAEANFFERVPAAGSSPCGRVSLTVSGLVNLSVDCTEIELTILRPLGRNRITSVDVSAAGMPVVVGPWSWVVLPAATRMDEMIRDSYGLRILDRAGMPLSVESLNESLHGSRDGVEGLDLVIRVRTPVGNKPARILLNGIVLGE